MADTNSILLSFGYGQEKNLPSDYTQGKIYITTDTHRMFVDLPGTDDRLCLNNFEIGGSMPPDDELAPNQFYIVTTKDGDQLCYSDAERKVKALINTAQLNETLKGLRADLGVKGDTADAGGSAFARIAQNVTDISAHASRLTAVEGIAGSAVQPEDLNSYVTTTAFSNYNTNLRNGYNGTLKDLSDKAQTGIDNAVTAKQRADNAYSLAEEANELAGSKIDQTGVETLLVPYAKSADVTKEIDADISAYDNTLRGGFTGSIKTLKDNYDKEIEDLKSADVALDARLDDIESVIDGVTNAMHFIGAFAEAPSTNGEEPLINGDVYINTTNNKEYVYSNNSWVELGDTTEELRRIGELEASVNGTSGLLARMTVAEGEIDNLQSAVEELTGWRTETADPTFADHESRIGALEETVEGHTDLLAGLRNDLGTNDKTTTTAFARIAAMEVIDAQQDSAIAQLGGQLTWTAF